MTQNAVFWLRDDFRIEDNPALSYASSNHNTVSALYIYDKSVFDDKREAQKWWLSRSLEEFKIDLEKYNICLEIVEGNQLSVLKKIKKSDNISVYWNKVYEPLEIKKDNEIIQFFQKNNIAYKNFRGNEAFIKIVKSSAFCSENNEIIRDNYKITKDQKIGIIPPIGGG